MLTFSSAFERFRMIADYLYLTLRNYDKHAKSEWGLFSATPRVRTHPDTTDFWSVRRVEYNLGAENPNRNYFQFTA